MSTLKSVSKKKLEYKRHTLKTISNWQDSNAKRGPSCAIAFRILNPTIVRFSVDHAHCNRDDADDE